MPENENMNLWKERPNRDEALEYAYAFIEAISRGADDEAAGFVKISDLVKFREKLNAYLVDFAKGWLEDDEVNDITGKWISNVNNPVELDEEIVNPVFEGKSFFLEKNEEFNLHIGFANRPTTIRLHFMLCEEDALYYLKFIKISNNPDLPALDH